MQVSISGIIFAHTKQNHTGLDIRYKETIFNITEMKRVQSFTLCLFSLSDKVAINIHTYHQI